MLALYRGMCAIAKTWRHLHIAANQTNALA